MTNAFSLRPWDFSFAPNATEVAPIAPGIIVSHKSVRIKLQQQIELRRFCVCANQNVG
jgi:hypothetical protein